MGSRTGASIKSIVGSNRKFRKEIAILSSPLSSRSIKYGNIQSGITYSTPIGNPVSPQTGNSRSIPSEPILSTTITPSLPPISEPHLSKEECESRVKILMKILIHSNPVLSIAYYTLSFTEKIIAWYPEIESAYQRGGDDAVVQLLIEKALKIGINIGINMIISEVADQSWISIKTEMGLETNPNQDQVAELVINKAFEVAIDAVKSGTPLNGELIYKQVCSALFDYFTNSLMESKSDEADHSVPNQPYLVISELNPEEQKLLREVVKNITTEIAKEFFERAKDGKTPNRHIMRKRLVGIVKDRYPDDIIDMDPLTQTHHYDSKNIIVTDEKSVQKTKNSIIFSTIDEVNDDPMTKENKMKLSFESLNWKHTPEEKDLANFAAFLYHMESLIRNKPDAGKFNILPNKVTFVVHSETDEETKILMEQISAFLLGYHPQFQIIEEIESRVEVRTSGDPIEKIDAVCLYSGGIDSTIGYFAAKEKYKNIKLVFVNHQINRIWGYVKVLVKMLNAENDLLEARAFSGGNNFLQQTRGFLYLTTAAIYANHLGSERVVISECGVTKYQPSISIADEITKTTHPLMLKLAKELFKKKGFNIEFSMPFDDHTKAEMVSLYRDQAALLKETYSCRGIRNTHENQRECGYCMGCLIKNIALTYVTGMIQEQFVLDPLTHNNSYYFVDNSGNHIGFNYSKMESVLQLIDFTSSNLRPEGSIHQSTVDMIEDYNKTDLFRRYSEDIIYGLFYMKRNKMLQNEAILAKLSSIEKESWFNADRIDERRQEIIQQNKKPVW